MKNLILPAIRRADVTESIERAQLRNAALYRAWARVSPWNSKTRQGWLELAQNAEALARRAVYLTTN